MKYDRGLEKVKISDCPIDPMCFNLGTTNCFDDSPFLLEKKFAYMKIYSLISSFSIYYTLLLCLPLSPLKPNLIVKFSKIL